MFVLERSRRTLAARHLLDQYRVMVRIRAFEEAAEACCSNGLIHGMTHSAVGQEAVAVGVCSSLSDGDLITSTHRNHHHALAKGIDVTAAMAELFGRATGVCGGKGGSMHFADLRVGMLGANGVVGASVAIAAGAAQGLLLQHSDAIAAAFFGDGGMNRGQCLEAMNYAAVYSLPLLLVCEDNGWSATTRISTVTAGPGFIARSEALGVPAVAVDGNDVEAVEQAARHAVDQVRSGGGPRLLHCKTYRLRGHTVVDKASYRPQSEVDANSLRDPIRRCHDRLRELGVGEAEIAAARKAEETAIRQAVETAAEAPWPPDAEAFRDIQDPGRLGTP